MRDMDKEERRGERNMDRDGGCPWLPCLFVSYLNRSLVSSDSIPTYNTLNKENGWNYDSEFVTSTCGAFKVFKMILSVWFTLTAIVSNVKLRSYFVWNNSIEVKSKNKERKIDGANKAIRLDLFAATSG